MTVMLLPPPAPQKPTLMQRVMEATGVAKAVRTIAASQQLGFGYFAPGNLPTPQAPKDFLPRKEDYTTGYNLNIQPRMDEPISFWDLFALAENDNITRLLIETRKDQVAALTWDVVVSGIDEDEEPSAEQDDRIAACKKFLKSPDGEHSFDEWLRMLLEDVLVFDAPCVYVNIEDPLRTKFQVVSGMTITKKVDINGRTPTAPDPAFQQIIKGTVAGEWSTEEMMYKPRNPRPNRVYGMSPVQQIVLTVNLALRKQMSQLYYFSEGTVPDALINCPVDWTPKQVSDFQKYWDELLAGNLAQKRHVQFVPGGTAITETKQAVLTDEADLWWTKVRCYAFSIPPTSFESKTNRATAQTAQNAAKEEGLAPLMNWVKSFVDECLQKHLGQHDLEFKWVEDDVMDPADKVAMLDQQLRSGAITLNEYREAMNRESYGPDGDEPMVYTATGPVLLKDVLNPPQPPALPGQPPGGQSGKPPAGGGSPNGEQPPNGQAGNGKQPPGKPPAKKPTQAQPGGAAPGAQGQAGRAGAGKAKAGSGPSLLVKVDLRRTLYISRPLINGDELVAWAQEQGLGSILAPHDMHVTIAFSRQPVDWNMSGSAVGLLRVATGIRKIEKFDGGALVLQFTSLQLQNRWQQIRDIGGSWDWPSYKPHVTLSYNAGDIDPDSIEPYLGVLEFGPEVFAEVNEDWKAGVKEMPLEDEDETQDDKEVGKAAATPFVLASETSQPGVTKARRKRPKVKGRRLAPTPRNYKLMQKTEDALFALIMPVFNKMASDVVRQLKAYKVKNIQKAEDDEDEIDPDDLNRHVKVDISDLDTLAAEDFPEHLTNLYQDAGAASIATIGANGGDGLVNEINTRAIEFGNDRAAELVGKKWVDGELVDNPNAEWAITDTTRDMTKDLINQGLDEGWGINGLADALENMKNEDGIQAFSAGRARMIARTETIRAHAKGDAQGLQQAQKAGVNVQKEWYADAEACDECLDNMDDGPIDLDDTFSSGDDEPPAHPNCECSLNGYLPDEEGDQGDDEEDDTSEDNSDESDSEEDDLDHATRDVGETPADDDVDMASKPDLLKYSDDQPRDEYGRFGEGGGGEAAQEQSSGSSRGGSAEKDSASSLYEKYNDPNVTADQIIDKVPGGREALQGAKDKLAQGVETQGQYQKDGVYTAEREAVHQQIIDKYINAANVAAATPAAGEKPTMTILGGRGGSGKSYLTSENGPVQGNGIDNEIHMVGNALYLNSDDIKESLPEYQGWNAALLHEEATDIFNKVDAQARELGVNIVHDSTMKNGTSAMARLSDYKAAGYNLEGHYMFAPPQQAATQAMGRFTRGTAKLSPEERAEGKTGRMVPPSYILGSTSNEHTFDQAKGMFSKWTIYSNVSGSPTLYAKGGH